MNRSTTVTLFAFSYRVAALMRAALVVCFTLGAPPLFAQTSSTEIGGLVTDTSGSVVAGAGVILTRTATAETRRSTTNADGLYCFPLIEPGEYKLDVTLSGFKSTTVSSINVVYQQRARIDIKLEIGELTQSVQVTSEARLLNTEDAAIGQNVESKRVVELPIAYPSIGQLALTVPGVSFGTRMGITTGSTGRTCPPGTAVALVANGQTDQTDGYTLDGVNKKGFTGATLGGWQLNGILAYRSGLPITITEAGSDLNTGGFTPTRPDRIANGTVANPSRQLWFDPQAFQRVTCNIPGRLDLCHYGSSGVGIISGPAQKNADLSLFKNFNIRETLNLQVRLEAINAFNTPFFGTPNGISFATNNSIKPDGSLMGQIQTLATPMRTVQIGMKLQW